MVNKKKKQAGKSRLNKIRQKIAKKVLDRKKKQVVNQIQSQSTSSQVGFLIHALDSGRLTPEKLVKAIKDKAPSEMAKGAKKIVKQGRTPTVDELMRETRKDKEFIRLVKRVGIDENYFIKLAEVECAKRGGQ